MMSVTRSVQPDAVRDQRIAKLVPLVTPQELYDELPLDDARIDVVLRGRSATQAVLDGRDDRLLVVIGPCSVHDPEATLDYASRLASEAQRHERNLLIAMRVYFEKPRTTIGWKGLINDPHLDNSGDVNAGLRIARQLLLEVLGHGLPIGCEFLDPITPQYISDLVSWGAIGARTTESQIHRQLGSGLSMPVGFKNRTDGNVQVAVDAVRAAGVSHVFPGIDADGRSAILHTRGNADCHVILRGGKGGPNYDADAVAGALDLLTRSGLPKRVMVDLSHDNSRKDPLAQPAVAESVAAQLAQGNEAIHGVMVESFLVEGRQDQSADMTYGQSITDGCLGWDQTVELLGSLAGGVRARRGDPSAADSAAVRIAIIGVGLIGGSVALGARQRVGAHVTGYDPDREALSTAVDLGALDATSDTLGGAVAEAEAIFVAAPVGRLPELLLDVLAAAPAGAVITDVGSTKQGLAPIHTDPRFIGGHPLAGAETAGVRHARADLFDGATWYLTPAPTTDGILFERLHRLIAALGARPVAIEADAHDAVMAAVSHLPHVVANVLVAEASAVLASQGERIPATGPSFRDATRVAGANTAIWTDIYMANRFALIERIDAVIDRLALVRADLAAEATESISAWNDEAATQRRALLETQLAGGELVELRVAVPNRAGVVAQITLELSRAGVNIADLALYPAPDMSEGVVALWIGGAEDAARAEARLAELDLAAVRP